MKSVFVSYSRHDIGFRDALVVHLRVLQDAKIIETWHDGEIAPGSDWNTVIDQALNAADIILLLISADFLASRYCQEVELRRALERWKHQKADIIPILVRDCDWQASPLSNLQMLPNDAVPVKRWGDPDHAWAIVTRAIRHIATADASIGTGVSNTAFKTTAAPIQAITSAVDSHVEGSLVQAPPSEQNHLPLGSKTEAFTTSARPKTHSIFATLSWRYALIATLIALGVLGFAFRGAWKKRNTYVNPTIVSLDTPAMHIEVQDGEEVLFSGSFYNKHDGSTIDAAGTTWPKETSGGRPDVSGGILDLDAGGFSILSRDARAHEVRAIASAKPGTVCLKLGMASPCAVVRLSQLARERMLTTDEFRRTLDGSMAIHVRPQE